MRNYWPLLVASAALSIHASANGATAPTNNDVRIVYSADPRIPLATHNKDVWVNVESVERSITTLPEPGYLDPNKRQFTIMRGADPTNSSKKAFRHKIVQGMAYRQDAGYQSARAEVDARWRASNNVYEGVPYWAAYAFYVDSDHPFNGTGEDLDILELGHGVTSKNSLPTPAFYVRRNATFDAMVSSNTVLDGTNSTRKTAKVFSKPISKGVWHYVVVQFKLEWDVSKRPYFRVWHAVGSQAPVQVANTNIANSYRESVSYKPQKFGLYQWNINNWGSSTSRTVYTKGLHVFRDSPGTPTLDVNSMFAFIRSM
jgi:hypothetical protein